MEVAIKFEDTSKDVITAAEKAIDRNLQRSAFAISKDAKASIQTAPPPVVTKTKDGKKRIIRAHAKRGNPPMTRRGRLRSAIRYDVDKKADVAVIGPQASKVGEVGAALEMGERFHGQQMDEFPFMDPALQKNEVSWGGSFEGSIGGSLSGPIGGS